MKTLYYQQVQKNTLILFAAFLIAFINTEELHSLSQPAFTNYHTTVYRTQEVHTQTVKVISQENLTEDIVKIDSPSVVTIVGSIPIEQNINSPSFAGTKVTKNVHSIGSGFIVSTRGVILTNKHAVSDPSETYQIITSDGKKYTIKNRYLDPNYDIAVITINPQENANETLKPAKIGDSSTLQVGQYVVAIGTSLGELRNTVTTGIVSGLNRTIQANNPDSGNVENLTSLIQTSAPINSGNSGGPLINDQDQVIGMNVANAPDGENIGFAIPIDLVKKTLSNYYEDTKKTIF